MFTPNEQGYIEFVENTINRKNLFFNVFQVPHNVLEDDKFRAYKSSIKVLYIYLAKLTNRYLDKKGWFWRSSKMLAEDVGLTENTVRAAKKRLVMDGFIEFKEGNYNPKTKIRHPGWFRIRGYRPVPIEELRTIQQKIEQEYDDYDEPYKAMQ